MLNNGQQKQPQMSLQMPNEQWLNEKQPKSGNIINKYKAYDT